MMKKIQLIIWSILVLCVGACTEDKGDYDYTPLNDLVVQGIEKDYTVEQFSSLKIPVTITAKDGFSEDHYEYLWYIWRVNNAADPDTLSFKKDLDIEVESVTGEYTMRYIVTDKETGVSYSVETDLTIVNSYSKGLMVLSEVEGNANVTFINVVNTVTEDAYEKVNGEVAGRSPRGIFYTGEGEFTKGLVVISTGDGSKVIEPTDFSYMMDFSEMFYFAPDPCVMECLCKNMYGYNEYVIMSGRVYTRNLSFVEDMFVKYDPQVKGDYEAAPFSMYESNDPFFYDQKGKRFIYDDYGKMISVESASGAFNPAAMEATMVYGVAFEDNVRAVMEDADGHHFVIAAQKRVEYDDDFYNSYIRVIPIRKVDLNQTDIGEATCFAVSSKDIDFLYYGYQNKIVCMSTVTGNVLATYDGFEEGNKIEYIEFDRSENPNRLYVGVSNGSGKAKSGSIYYLRMSSNGSLEEENHFNNICGRVVDFEYNK